MGKKLPLIPGLFCASAEVIVLQDGPGISSDQAPGGPAASAAGVSPGELQPTTIVINSINLVLRLWAAASNHKPQATGSEPRLNQL
jgi:hypothetical protein